VRSARSTNSIRWGERDAAERFAEGTFLLRNRNAARAAQSKALASFPEGGAEIIREMRALLDSASDEALP